MCLSLVRELISHYISTRRRGHALIKIKGKGINGTGAPGGTKYVCDTDMNTHSESESIG